MNRRTTEPYGRWCERWREQSRCLLDYVRGIERGRLLRVNVGACHLFRSGRVHEIRSAPITVSFSVFE